MASQGELFLEFVAHFSPTKVCQSWIFSGGLAFQNFEFKLFKTDVNPMIVDLTEKYIRNSEEKEFKKHMIFTGRLAKFLLDELKKERDQNQQLIEENKRLESEILVSLKIDNWGNAKHIQQAMKWF